MKNTLYLECYSGISGDMMVASLLDLGADQEVLLTALQSLKVHGFEARISRVKKSGLDACDFDVVLDAVHENHDHDMEYLHGDHHHHHHSDDKHTHDAHQHHVHHHHDHPHEHRGLTEILHIISHAQITDRAKELSSRIFTILAQTEAKAHGKSIDEVHFHEVGAVDSIVDIVAVAVCIDNLGIDEVIVPVLYEGTGFIQCQHGVIPVPVPAVSYIAAEHGLTLHITNYNGEFVTPTGAAIVAALRTSDKLPERFTISKIGLGAGKRNYERASILRAMLIKDQVETEKDRIVKLETNIDDSTGESLGYLMDKLFEAGARDVHYIAVIMKKNRPAWQINVICTPDQVARLEQIIFEETTTIGIRRQYMDRSFLRRSIRKVETSLGEVLLKQCRMPDGTLRIYPEYDSIVALCRKCCMTYQDVYQLVIRECHGK